MRFHVLGPVRMEQRTPSAAKPRIVLATLLVQSNNVVSTHSLIDELWGMEPPRTAATTLQVYVSQLRKALVDAGDDRQPLLTRPPGYVIQVRPDELDLAVFESLRTRGRAAYERRDYEAASRLLGESLALWSGPALSGIPHGPSLETNAIRLNELRTEVLEQRIAADLLLGHHQELIGELMALVHEFPMRETLHAHLMVALYRSGRESDALQTYHRARRTLIDELGVEPGPTLTRLLDRVLAADPGLAWHDAPVRESGTGAAAPAAGPKEAAPPHRLPPVTAHFTGRTEELARGRRFLAAGGAATDRVLAISGRPGVGKTSLAVQLAHSAEGFADGKVQIGLRNAAGAAVPAPAAMAMLLRRLWADGADAAGPLPAGTEELGELLHRHTRGRELLLVLDDVVSESQVRPLLASVPDSMVVLTGRRTLAALDHVQHLVLDVLSPQEARRLLVDAGGPRMAQNPAAVAELARLCGRLPLALRVAAGSLTARPHWTAGALAKRLADERTRLSALTLGDLDVRSGLLAAYQDVGKPERAAFRLLGLAPLPDFRLWTAAALLGLDPPQAERRLESLVRAHLLEARQQTGARTPVHYGFHSLLRSLALEILAEGPASVVPEATDRLGRACVELARRADALLTPGRDRLAASDGLPVAGPPGLSPLAWFRSEAGGLLDVARQTHAAGLWRLTYALASAMSGYYEACARWDDWQSCHDLALDAARRAEDVTAEAVVVRSLGDLAWQRRQYDRAIGCYRRAGRLFARQGDRIGAGRCSCGEADVLFGRGKVAEAGKHYARALAAGRAEGDARGAADALRGLAFVALCEGRAGDARGLFAECADVAAAGGDERWHAYARRTAALVAANGDASWARLEVRPGVWLLDPSLG
ncbi:AfsR/SARP family transcriptional regulator [Streptomyces sp. NBC_01257]|uniref:AfsR/SARP family transcriptional regulator n=1 Tax=Streptomyces sp. NBC_01257 TaxID=2903799 RepID=UPI002DD7E48F|nr:BTAD domain-containing putative transcriptional regulator [Streptomyces sp. NBC_01257]WRZ66408.1 NB-ARC domain-containing protein [Streptomyces sp. NBC_01257]